MKEGTKFNFMERIMLQHSYLPKLISDCIGNVLGIYFLWVNNLAYALISLFGFQSLEVLLSGNRILMNSQKQSWVNGCYFRQSRSI